LEQIGEISAAEAGAPKSVTSSGNIICMLGGETHVFLAEVKLRPDTDCVVNRRAVLQLPGTKDDKHYLDTVIFQISPGNFRLGLLGERKNKERFVAVVDVLSSGRVLALGEELGLYDKASMLGKGISNLTAFQTPVNGEADLLVFSNIVRKLKVEENGSVIKPTSGRVPIPPECMDGTLSVSASETKKGFSIQCSFKTKSAGKNKFQINWFQGRKDEISVPAGKSFIKLGEENEPAVLLADPRDSRSAYVITNSQAEGTAALYKLVRGRKLDDPIASFPFSVQEAVFLEGPDRSLFLLVLNPQSLSFLVFHLTKTEGYRGLAAVWSSAPQYNEHNNSFFHAISCSLSKWQLQGGVADYLVSPRCHYQLGLATLATKTDIALEPESGAQYRLRLLGGDQINDILVILLDDIERTFEAEEENLANMNLKVCLTGSPGREGLSEVSGWLMAGRLSSVEIHCTRVDNDCPSGSDRLIIHSISPDLLRSYVVEQDWTQVPRKEGTFVLESGGPTPASIRTSTPARPASSRSHGSRIPSASSRRSVNLDLPPVSPHQPDLSAVIAEVEETVAPLARANAQIRESLEQLERNLVDLRSMSTNGHLLEEEEE